MSIIGVLRRNPRNKGVVAYTLLCNHIPINGYLIGTNDYEGNHVFDIWYRNTDPTHAQIDARHLHAGRGRAFVVNLAIPNLTKGQDMTDERKPATDEAISCCGPKLGTKASWSGREVVTIG